MGSMETQGSPITPRPGWVRTIAIINIVGSILLTLWAIGSALSTIVMGMMGDKMPVVPGPNGGKPVQMSFEFIRDPVLMRFWVADLLTSLPLNVIMFVTGIGLINQRRWAARWWIGAAWAKCVRLIAVYSYFIMAVVPVMSLGVAKMVISMFAAQKMPPKGAPSLADLTMIYNITYGVMGVLMIVTGVIYPLVSIWMLSRPGVQVVLTGNPPKPAALSELET